MSEKTPILRHEVFENFMRNSLEESLLRLNPKPLTTYACINTKPFVGSYNIFCSQVEPIIDVLKQHNIDESMYSVVKHSDDVLFSIIINLH